MKITKSELRQIIREEALKIRKIQQLQEQAAKINKKLKALNEGYEEDMEEGFFGRMLGYQAPKAIMDAVNKSKNPTELATNLTAALQNFTKGQKKEVEWGVELRDAVLSMVGGNKALYNKDFAPIIGKYIKFALPRGGGEGMIHGPA